MSLINWQRFGPSTACYLTLVSLILYVGSYFCLVNRWKIPGSMGVFAWPQYSQNRYVDGFLQEIYTPIYRLDSEVRKDYWAYKCYQCLPEHAVPSQESN